MLIEYCDFIDRLPGLASPEELRDLDKRAIEFGIPETMLIENAGRAALQTLESAFGLVKDAPIWLFMGNGNNGGDAACLARLLKDKGALPRILHLKPLDSYTGAAAWHLNLALKDNVPCAQLSAANARQIFLNILADEERMPAVKSPFVFLPADPA